MKRFFRMFVLCALALAMSCQKPPAPASTVGDAERTDATSGFVVFSGLGLATITDGKVKYIDSLTLGEKVALTGQATTAGATGSERSFVEVKRESGKTGWARTDYIISSSLLGVVTTDGVVIYNEPKNAAATARTVPKLTILALALDSAGQAFIKVTLVDPSSQVLAKDVYLKNSGVSTRTDDVQSAILLQLAAASTKPAQKQAFLESAAKDYPGSVFITQIEDTLTALTAPTPVRQTEKFFASMVSTADAVNVRDTPDENAGKVIGTLSSGQAVDVEEMTSESFTIKDQTAPWYKIKEPAGWVFGAFLSAGD
jgi:hypothetical protein